ncbi:MAG: TfpX/TfpZ family type IV pilin accessory protein [Pseudomonadota bacterium]
MSKLKAVALHFAVSFLIVATVFTFIFTQWYPAPFFTISGAASVLPILVGVDLVLGPLLTAIVYRPGKPSLRFDMTVIAIIQIAALSYGTNILFQERPQYLVFAVDRFVMLPARDLVRDSFAPIEACESSSSPPCVVIAQIPDDLKAREQLMMRALETGVDIERLPEYWVSLAAAPERVLDRSASLNQLAALDPALQSEIDEIASRQDASAETLRYVPVVNKRLQGMALVIDPKTAAALDVVARDPWVLQESATPQSE